MAQDVVGDLMSGLRAFEWWWLVIEEEVCTRQESHCHFGHLPFLDVQLSHQNPLFRRCGRDRFWRYHSQNWDGIIIVNDN